MIDVKAGDFLDALSSQREHANGARVRRVYRRARRLQPTIEPDELVFIQPACTDRFRLSWNARRRVNGQMKAARGF